MEIFDTILDQDQRIGQFLIGKNIIDEKQVELISQKAKESNVKFGEAAVNMGLAEEVEILEALADQQGLPYIDLKFFNIERSAINHLDKETARRLLAVPLFEAEDVLAVGFHDPLDLEAIDEIALKTGRTIEVILCI